MALKRLGKTRGERFARVKGVRATTSSRKFDSRGDWHYFTMGPLTSLYWMIFNRTMLQKKIGAGVIHDYWYNVRKPSDER